jgi:hypothetical protein
MWSVIDTLAYFTGSLFIYINCWWAGVCPLNPVSQPSDRGPIATYSSNYVTIIEAAWFWNKNDLFRWVAMDAWFQRGFMMNTSTHKLHYNLIKHALIIIQLIFLSVLQISPHNDRWRVMLQVSKVRITLKHVNITAVSLRKDQMTGTLKKGYPVRTCSQSVGRLFILQTRPRHYKAA